ncbi:MAG: ABC-2 family transporter protein [Lachnospiraceae bacterium]|nr:ABC-2 family transporter protein [Lachnospiraceae bacterium]
MRVYLEFAFKKFQNRLTYRLDFFMGIINTVITIIVFCLIYKALYGEADNIDGITFSMVATNFVISLGLSGAFGFDEMFLQNKLHDGSITNEFLKPVNFKLRMLSENIGDSIFKIIFNFVPALLFSIFFIDFCAPKSILSVILMIISVALGYLVLWMISFIVQTWCFWLFSVWGIVTIKNVFVNILSGTMLPIWFMPSILRKIVSYTPFESIYFTPVRIYLGEITGKDIFYGIVVQIFWIAVLYLIGNLFWKNGVRKLVVQGG